MEDLCKMCDALMGTAEKEKLCELFQICQGCLNESYRYGRHFSLKEGALDLGVLATVVTGVESVRSCIKAANSFSNCLLEIYRGNGRLALEAFTDLSVETAKAVVFGGATLVFTFKTGRVADCFTKV